MALSSTSRPGIRGRVLSRLPATLQATGGLSVSKENGIWTLEPDWTQLGLTTGVADAANQQVWVFNTATGGYERMSVQSMIASVATTGAGQGYAFSYVVSTSTTDADPGDGTIRLNNATQNLSTAFFVDLLDASGLALTEALDSLDDSTNPIKGTWSLTKISDATKRLIGTLSAVTTATGYRKLVIDITASSDANPFSSGDLVLFTFALAGDMGLTDIEPFIGDSGSGGGEGLVPAPSTGDAEKFLKGSGSFELVDYTFPAPFGVNVSVRDRFAEVITARDADIPSDGSADASALIQEVVDWVEANRPEGAFIDLSGGTFRMDGTVTVTGNDIVVGGSGPGRLAVFNRNHDAGPLFTFQAPGSGAIAAARCGIQYSAVRDLGTGTNGDGQTTGCAGTFANSPYGVVFDTVVQPVLHHMEFYNESLATLGCVGGRPQDLEFLIIRELESGRIAWTCAGGELASTALPRGGGFWGLDINLECGLLDGSSASVPSCDYGIFVSECDGFYIDQIHIQNTNLAHIVLASSDPALPMSNIGFSAAFLDIGAGSGMIISGSEQIASVQFDGVVSGLSGAGTGVNILGPVVGGTFNLQRVEGWGTAGVNIASADSKNIDIKIGQMANVAGTGVAVNGGSNITIHPGIINGVNGAGSGALLSQGVYFGADAVSCTVSGGKITKCTNNVVIDTGATTCGVVGVDLRAPFTGALVNLGTSTAAKANLGASDI